jgi:hypothetical protein
MKANKLNKLRKEEFREFGIIKLAVVKWIPNENRRK